MACKERASVVAMPGLYVHRAVLMEQEFLTFRDSRSNNLLFLRGVPSGSLIALVRLFFRAKIHDAEDQTGCWQARDTDLFERAASI
jgi:hypothetical protein